MSSRHTIKSAFDLERREPQSKICRHTKQQYNQRSTSKYLRTLPHTGGNRFISAPGVHLYRGSHFFRLGELELPGCGVLLLYRISHNWFWRFRSN